eukprot:scaffold234175_cov21-Tisochrysis_lutea.AAC.1
MSATESHWTWRARTATTNPSFQAWEAFCCPHSPLALLKQPIARTRVGESVQTGSLHTLVGLPFSDILVDGTHWRTAAVAVACAGSNSTYTVDAATVDVIVASVPNVAVVVVVVTVATAAGYAAVDAAAAAGGATLAMGKAFHPATAWLALVAGAVSDFCG